MVCFLLGFLPESYMHDTFFLLLLLLLPVRATRTTHLSFLD
jgi:hypothetical protein